MNLYEQAVRCAAFAHAGQVDKVGVPYILHPMAVAATLSDQPEHVRAAAVLHDVVEDTGVTLEELATFFPVEVVNLVSILTRRPEEKYFDYIRRVRKGGAEAIAIKIADIQHNTLPERKAPDADSMNKRYEKALKILRETV